MKYVGVDLHKHLIVLCVVVLVAGCPKVVGRARFRCDESEAIRGFFQKQWAFQVVVEATAACSPRWRQMFLRLYVNTGSKKKAIVGVARHLLSTMSAIL